MRRILAGLFVLAAAAAAHGQTDEVTLKDGKKVKCKITVITSTGITYLEGTKSNTVKNGEFTDFILGDVSEHQRTADAEAARKNWEKAIIFYGKALEDATKGRVRPFHKEFIYWALAHAHRGKGDADAALEALKTLRKECGDGSKRRDSYTLSLDIARKKGDSNVQEVLAEMKNEPQPLGGEAEMEIARIRYEKGDFKGAQEVYDRLSRATAQPYCGDARLWNIRCLRALKDNNKLRTACKEALDNRAGASMALLQAASSAMGDLLMQDVQKDPTKLRDALLAFAQAIAMGPPGKDENSEDYESALYNGAKCYLTLSNQAAKAEVKEDYKNRAVNYLIELARGYKNTSWGKLAEKELAVLGVGDKPKESGKPK